MALGPSPSASSPKNPDKLPAFRAAKSTAISHANRCRIPFIRQTGAGLADGTIRRSNDLWTRKRPAGAAKVRLESPLASVRRAHAGPAVAHLMIVHGGIIGRHSQSEHLRREPPDR